MDDPNSESFRKQMDGALTSIQERFPRAGAAAREFIRDPMSGNALRRAFGRGQKQKANTESAVTSLPPPVLWEGEKRIVISQYSNYTAEKTATFWNTTVGDLRSEYGEITRFEHHDIPQNNTNDFSYQLATLGKYIYHHHGNRPFWDWYGNLMVEGATDIEDGIDIARRVAEEFDESAAITAIDENQYGVVIGNDMDSLLGKVNQESYVNVQSQINSGDPVFMLFINGTQIQATFDSIVGAIERIRSNQNESKRNTQQQDSQQQGEREQTHSGFSL